MGGRLTTAIFIKVARTAELTHGQGMLVVVELKRIAIFNVGGCYYALDDLCAHRGGPLSEGELEGTTVVCPCHGAILYLVTGDVTRPNAPIGVVAYEVRLDGGEISIAVKVGPAWPKHCTALNRRQLFPANIPRHCPRHAHEHFYT